MKLEFVVYFVPYLKVYTMFEIVCFYDFGNDVFVQCWKWYFCTMLDFVFLYDVGNGMLLRNCLLYDIENGIFVRCWKYDVGSRMLLLNWKLFVVKKLEIVCCYQIGNRMLYHVGSRMFSRCCKSYAV